MSRDSANGFSEWGGYMSAKVTKLEEQFALASDPFRQSNLFAGISIYVNGLTNPSADELKRIMMVHGGTYHHYERSHTTFIIASNLPDVKVRNMNTSNIISPQWVLDCMKEQRIVDYSRYLLYTNQKTSQPRLNFKKTCDTPTSVSNKFEPSTSKINKQTTSNETALQGSNNNNKNSNDTVDQRELARESAYSENIFQTGELKSKLASSLVSEERSLLMDEEKGTNEKEMEAKRQNEVCKKTAFIDENVDAEELAIIRKDLEKLNEQIRLSFKIPSPTGESIERTAKATSSSSAARTAVDPKFLTEFYNNSRLHHIATLGAGFKEYVSDLREKHFSNNAAGFVSRHIIKEKLMAKYNEHTPRNDLPAGSCIMHIDMDCFFVSVGLKFHPELRGKPVAVTHSKGGASAQEVPMRKGVDREVEKAMLMKRFEQELRNNVLADKVRNSFNAKSSLSEIASCSYEARAKGIHNGMFVGQALKLCPDLKTIPYDFEGYKEVAYALYNIIASYTLEIEAVSCDEMYVDLSDILKEIQVPTMDFVQAVRDEIRDRTGCPCSAGIGANKLQARMATKKAKPDGQYSLINENMLAYMSEIPIEELPGVGWSNANSLKEAGYTKCGDLQQASMPRIQAIVGRKLGETLYQFSRGVDKRPLVCEQIRKSVSVEVNYGIRFKTNAEMETFLHQLCEELHKRLCKVQRKTKCITLKVMVRAKDAPIETSKFMGHGVCENITKSISLSQFTDDLDLIKRTVLATMKALNLPPNELRGLGIHVSKLNEPNDSNSKESKHNVIQNMFLKAAEKKREKDLLATNTSEINKNVSKIPTEPIAQEKTIELPLKCRNQLGDLFAKAAEKQKAKNMEKLESPESEAHNNNTHIDDNSRDSTTSNCSLSPRKCDKQIGPNLKRPRATSRHTSLTAKNSKKGAKNPKTDIKDILQNLSKKTITTKTTQIPNANQQDSHLMPASRLQPPAINIDLNVLAELPFDIQAAIIREYQLNIEPIVVQFDDAKPSTSKQARERELSNKQECDASNDSNNNANELNANYNSQNIFIKQNAKQLLLTWVQNSEKPEKFDIDFICENACHLITSLDNDDKVNNINMYTNNNCNTKYLDDLYDNLTYLTKILNNLWFEQQENPSKIINGSNCAWHLAYLQIIENVQNTMRQYFNNRKLYLGMQLSCIECQKTLLYKNIFS